MTNVAAHLPEAGHCREQSVAGNGLENSMPQPVRQAVVKLEHVLNRVARVAAEQLVAPVAGEQTLESAFLCAGCAEVRRKHRGIAEGLIERCSNQGDRFDDIFGRYVVLVMGKPE